METWKQYIGPQMDSSIYPKNGKYGQYLNHNKRLCSVPQCFQKPIFNLKGAIKIIEGAIKIIEYISKQSR